MTNKISSLFTSQINRLVPYLTPRAGLISLLALGALSALVYFFLRNPQLPPVTPPLSPRNEEDHERPLENPAPFERTAAASSVFLPLSEDLHFKDNVQAIVNFPVKEAAQIESIDGKLERTDDYLRPTIRTKLPETLCVITNTFLIAFQQFERAKSTIEMLVDPKEKLSHLHSLCDLLTQEVNLLTGLGNICQIYLQRSQNSPGKEELVDLVAFYNNKTSAITTHCMQYERLILSLQAN